MSDTPALLLEHVCKSFRQRGREVRALVDCSVAVGPGQVAALVGPNGAGKTTALRIMATLVTPSSGRALVFGRDTATEQSAVRRSVGLSLGGARSFYWRLTARRNLAFFARLKGVPAVRTASEVTGLAAELDLERFLERPARSLSRGVLARLSVARACLGEPSLLLLDEPFSSVDERARDLIWRVLARRIRAGAAVVLATHDRESAERCDIVVGLEGGGARRDGAG